MRAAVEAESAKRVFDLRGHCHGDFSVFWSKLLKYLTSYLFANIKLLLEHRE